MRQVRLGLVGVGAWARRYVEAAKQLQDPQVSFVAYARKSAEKVDWLPDAVRVDHPMDFLRGTVAGFEGVDGVVIACGPGPAVKYVEMALDAGVPALVEKPVTTDCQEALRLLALAAEGSSESFPWVRAGYVHLHAPAYLRLRAVLARQCEEWGDRIIRIESEGSGYGPWRSYSCLWDYGPHDAAMVFDLLRATGESGFSFEVPRVARVSFDKGERWEFEARVAEAAVAVTVSNAVPTKTRRLLVETRKGRRFVYDDREPVQTKLVIDGAPQVIDERGALTVMLDNFVYEIVESKRPEDHLRDPELTVKVTELLKVVERLGSAD